MGHYNPYRKVTRDASHIHAPPGTASGSSPGTANGVVEEGRGVKRASVMSSRNSTPDGREGVRMSVDIRAMASPIKPTKKNSLAAGSSAEDPAAAAVLEMSANSPNQQTNRRLGRGLSRGASRSSMSGKVSGWGAYCCDFSLLPAASCGS